MRRRRGDDQSEQIEQLRRSVADLERERLELFARLTAVERERAGLAGTLPIAAHQLLSPVQTLLLWCDAIVTRATRDQPVSKSWLVMHAARMRRQLERISALMHAAIEIWRAELGDPDAPQPSCDLVALVRAVAAAHAEDAAEAGCTITVDAPETLVGPWDPNPLPFIVAGLLSNAVKHGGGSPVRVELLDGHTRATLRVSDEGPGLGAVDAERIFHPFERAGSADGFGLGLWIVRELTRSLGGSVTAGADDGRGARFTVVLRKSAHVASARRGRLRRARAARSKELRP